MNMMDFFKEGGFGMWPILVLGVILLVVAVRFAVRPDRQQLGFLGALAAAVVVATIHATWTDLGAVFGYFADAHHADAPVTRALMEGLKESTRPGSFGGGILTLSLIFVAVGAARFPRTAPSAA
jgi:hypothetical protein